MRVLIFRTVLCGDAGLFLLVFLVLRLILRDGLLLNLRRRLLDVLLGWNCLNSVDKLTHLLSGS